MPTGRRSGFGRNNYTPRTPKVPQKKIEGYRFLFNESPERARREHSGSQYLIMNEATDRSGDVVNGFVAVYIKELTQEQIDYKESLKTSIAVLQAELDSLNY